MLSACAVQPEGTQLTCACAARTQPTENVQSSVVMSSISMMRRAISLTAERPSRGSTPAWLGLPVAASSKRAMA